DLVARQPGDVDLVEERGEREHVIPGVLTTEHVQVQGTCSVVDQPRCDDTDLLAEIAVEREGHMYGFPFPRSSSGYVHRLRQGVCHRVIEVERSDERRAGSETGSGCEALRL